MIDAGGIDPLHTWQIPVGSEGEHVELVARRGEAAVVVGANGSGKSALGVWLERNAPDGRVERLTAHRRMWMTSPGPNLTLEQRDATTQNVRQWNRSDESRWRDHADGQRVGLALFDLLASDDHRSRQIAALHDRNADDEDFAKIPGSPVGRLNEVLQTAGLAVTIKLNDRSAFDAVRDDDSTYPIHTMSDGEKSALILTAEVLTAEPDTIYLLDEPERHMHRSISPSLISAAIAARPDCYFVVLTHDLDLAAGLPPSTTTVIAVDSCRWEGTAPATWDAHVVPTGASAPESVRRAILGGRHKVMFIEGTVDSLDLPLYSLLYRGWAHTPAGSCNAVIRDVRALQENDSLHWVEAIGIVDGDGRNEPERDALRANGIFAMAVNEVENVYYSSPVMTAVAAGHAEATGQQAAELLEKAQAAALAALRAGDAPSRLAAANAERIVQRVVRDAIPDRKALAHAGETVQIAVHSPYQEKLDEINALLAGDDLDGIIARFPIRETAMRKAVASAFGFTGYDLYERLCRTVIRKDSATADAARALIGALPT